MKAKNKKTNKHVTVMYIWLTILTIAIVVSASITFYMFYRGDPFINSRVQELQETQSRFRFCYDNNVTPCTDSRIEDWNEANPDDSFRI